ncbi:MAG: sulfite exporter TauE/SafE family protein [Alphaproteobacteria bacterium]|jgi:hypothetical protein|nr:sulfite exporter TauE/SafE family protein [Alphaproteobacteria bacterium]
MLPFEPTFASFLLVAVAFFAAGLCKGVLGVGTPLVAVPILTGVMHPATTISVLAVPMVLANIWQSVEGGGAGEVVRRFWPAAPASLVGAVIGAQFLTEVDPASIQLLIGAVLALFAASQFKSFVVPHPGDREVWLTPCVGFASGLLGGITTFFGPPLILYLVALRLTKDAFVASIALLYLVGTVPLFTVLAWKGVLGPSELVTSLAGTVVILAAMALGRWLRQRVPQEAFRRALFVVLVLMGLNMIRRALM